MKRGIVFPQCGSQYVGMGKELYDIHRIVQEYFEDAIECSSINFIKLCFAASETDMNSWEQGPLALLLVEFASSALVRSVGIAYDVAVGFDMTSWYAAVHAAQAITLPDGLYIIKKWIDGAHGLREERAYGTVKIDGSRPSTDAMVTTLCDQAFERNFFLRVIAISPHHITVGGDGEGLVYLQEILQREDIAFEQQDGIDCVGIALPPDRAQQVQQYLEKIDFIEPHCAVINPLTGDMMTTAEELRVCARELLVRPLRHDRVVRAVQAIPELICSIPAARSLDALKKDLPDARWWSMDIESHYEAMRQALASQEIQSSEQS